MKVLRVFIVLGLASLQFEANAQFRFPQLPSPPRIIFGGFRPFFPRPRPRPRPPRPPFLVPSSQFLQQQQQQQNRFPQRPFSRPLTSLFDFGQPPRPTRPQRPPPPPSRRPPPPPLPPLQSNSISPPLAFGPPPVAQQFSPARPALSAPPSPSFQQTNDLSFRPPQVITSQNPVISVDGFGAPRPDSIVSISQLPSQQQSRPPPPRPSPQPSPQQFTLSSFPPPLIGPSSNNIIGMTPPPPPAPTASPTPRPTLPPLPPQTTVVVTVTQPSTIGPLVPITARPSRPLSAPSSNALDDLLVNPVPSLNAGILPLANEKPSETQLFPPFT
ncbi:uncharacterized protein [Macrobrachium rosenbergii]|uniref:uncharacterized protein isoform X2 n=1 Tax=Macrobrachium rosenbergii TaxID=79674 RepID=UPI0034D6E642